MIQKYNVIFASGEHFIELGIFPRDLEIKLHQASEKDVWATVNKILRYPDEIEKIIEESENFVERIIAWLQEELCGPSKIVFGTDYPFAANLAPFVTKDFEKFQ